MQSESDRFHTESTAATKPSSPIRRLLLRFAGVLAALLAVSTAVYYSVSAYRLTHGVRAEAALPQYDIRVGLVNGTADPSLSAAATQQLQSIRTADWTVMVAVSDQFTLHRVKESFLICRDGQRAAAELLANRIGIPADRIVEQPAPGNSERMTVSLVLGEDYRQLQRGSRKL